MLKTADVVVDVRDGGVAVVLVVCGVVADGVAVGVVGGVGVAVVVRRCCQCLCVWLWCCCSWC